MLVVREMEEASEDRATTSQGAIGSSEEDGNELGQTLELSINSVMGLTTSGTMKLKGKISQWEVIVLVDSGTSHNFIVADIIQQLGLPLLGTTGYGVIMGTSLTINDEYACKQVLL